MNIDQKKAVWLYVAFCGRKILCPGEWQQILNIESFMSNMPWALSLFTVSSLKKQRWLKSEICRVADSINKDKTGSGWHVLCDIAALGQWGVRVVESDVFFFVSVEGKGPLIHVNRVLLHLQRGPEMRDLIWRVPWLQFPTLCMLHCQEGGRLMSVVSAGVLSCQVYAVLTAMT